MSSRCLSWMTAVIIETTDDDGECVLWPFSTDRRGYGQVRYNGKLRRAHHVALIFDGREVPLPPLEVRHLCGIRRCINPAHLAPGTVRENAADRVLHGTDARGINNPMGRLTDDEVRAIRASDEHRDVLAERYGIHRSTVTSIRNRTKRAGVV